MGSRHMGLQGGGGLGEEGGEGGEPAREKERYCTANENEHLVQLQ